MNWLVASVVLSVLLMIVLNAGLRLFPRATDRATRRLDEWIVPPVDGAEYRRAPRVRVFFPWRTMLLASIVLTVLLNAGRWATR